MSDLKLIGANPDPDEALLNMLRLDPAKVEAAVKVPISLQVRKPQKHEFIRVHPDLELAVSAIELKDDDVGFYLVAANMAAALSEESAAYVLRPYVNRAGVLRLWPIRLPGSDGKVNHWHHTAATAAAHAMKRWVRVTANRSAGNMKSSTLLISHPHQSGPICPSQTCSGSLSPSAGGLSRMPSTPS